MVCRSYRMILAGMRTFLLVYDLKNLEIHQTRRTTFLESRARYDVIKRHFTISPFQIKSIYNPDL